MNLLQILGLEDVMIPTPDQKEVLFIRAGLYKNGSSCVSAMPKNYTYRQRSSPILYNSNGCSVKRIGKAI